MMSHYMTGSMMFLGPLMWIASIVVFVLILKWIFKDREDRPLEIAKKRYARGEISKEEFEERRKDLT